VNVQPSASFTAELAAGTSGLVGTIAVAIYQGDSVVTALHTSSINEIVTTGIYVATLVYLWKRIPAERFSELGGGAPFRLLHNKWYVDELYDATVIGGTTASARHLWTFDRNVVDGAVNGTSRVTVVGSWFSGATDRTVVDGLVNLVGWVVQESSHAFRRFQTGLVQNYALLMLFGIFAFMSIYLLAR